MKRRGAIEDGIGCVEDGIGCVLLAPLNCDSLPVSEVLSTRGIVNQTSEQVRKWQRVGHIGARSHVLASTYIHINSETTH